MNRFYQYQGPYIGSLPVLGGCLFLPREHPKAQLCRSCFFFIYYYYYYYYFFFFFNFILEKPGIPVSNLRPLVYKESDLSTAPRRLLCRILSLLFFVRYHKRNSTNGCSAQYPHKIMLISMRKVLNSIDG